MSTSDAFVFVAATFRWPSFFFRRVVPSRANSGSVT